MPDAVIAADRLSYTYHQARRPALDAVSVHIAAGHITGLVGHNGAGKTTLIRVLTGVLRPAQGHVHVAGHPLYQSPSETQAAKRAIGTVPDVPTLYDRLTGREFVRFSAQLYGVAAGAPLEHRIAQLLASLDLAREADERISGYSLGTRKKVAVCAALVHAPSALILDEPFDGLDPLVRRRLKEALRAHAAAGCAILLSTHGLELAQGFCDRLLLLQHGRLIADGDLEHLRARVGAAPHTSLEDVFVQLMEGAGPERRATVAAGTGPPPEEARG